MISNEQIPVKSGFIRQAKHQRSSGLFENDSINKVQSVCWGTCYFFYYWIPTEGSGLLFFMHNHLGFAQIANNVLIFNWSKILINLSMLMHKLMGILFCQSSLPQVQEMVM